MNAEKRREAVRRMFLALWAMGTFILVFVIALLVYTMVEQGQNPLALTNKLKPSAPAPADRSADNAPRQRTKEIKLYFAAPAGGYLLAESRGIDYSESTVANCKQALEALIQGPTAQDAYSPILPSSAKLRAMYALENGELVIDFAQSQLSQQKAMASAASEALFVYGIVNTMTQPSLQGTSGGAIKAVRFLFEGFAPQDAFPSHVDLSGPVTPDSAWDEPAGIPAAAPDAKGEARGNA